MDVAEQKVMFERLAARTALRHYTIPEMVKRSIRNPHHAMHVAKKLVTTAFNS
jgi:hypothetical protein